MLEDLDEKMRYYAGQAFRGEIIFLEKIIFRGDFFLLYIFFNKKNNLKISGSKFKSKNVSKVSKNLILDRKHLSVFYCLTKI